MSSDTITIRATDDPSTRHQDRVELGRQLRVDSIRAADAAGSGHPTSSMSAADLVAVLITGHLRLDLDDPDGPESDRLVFSKGHASPLLYAAWKALGLIDDDTLLQFRQLGSALEGHPVPRLPGVPVASGSLGLGPAMGVGMAIASRELDRTDAHTWVLCGDGELAEGAVWEALEHAGWLGLGGLSLLVDVNRLGQTGPTRYGWDTDAYRARFEAHGWRAIEIDGHDVDQIDSALGRAATSDRPMAVIARTQKGSGASETENVEGKHGKPLDDPEAAIAELGGMRSITVVPRRPQPRPAGDAPPAESSRTRRDAVDLPTWSLGDEVATRTAFGDAIAAWVAARGDLVALDGEVGNSTGLDEVEDVGDGRFRQFFIAEQLLVAAAIGLASRGWHPVVSTFGAFTTRAYDVLRMATISRADLCLVGSHAGVSIGEDGPSQMALEDVAMMRALHGTTVLQPCDANQTARLLGPLLDRDGIGYLRTLRGDTPVIYGPDDDFEIGGSRLLGSGEEAQATIVASGVTVHEALEAADRLAERSMAVDVIDAYSIEPLDIDTIAASVTATGGLVVVEDHRPQGGLGEAVTSGLATVGAGGYTFRHLAVRTMPGSATPEEQRRAAGIDAAAIVDAVTSLGALLSV